MKIPFKLSLTLQLAMIGLMLIILGLLIPYFSENIFNEQNYHYNFFIRIIFFVPGLFTLLYAIIKQVVLNKQTPPSYREVDIINTTNESSSLETIRMLIGEDRLCEAISFLSKHLKPEYLNNLILIQNQYSHYKTETAKGLISEGQLRIIYNNIVSSLLTLSTKTHLKLYE